MKTDTDEYISKLHLIEFFALEKDQLTDQESIFHGKAHGKGSYTPSGNRNRKLYAAINYLKAQMFEETFAHPENGISESEREGIKEIKGK